MKIIFKLRPIIFCLCVSALYCSCSSQSYYMPGGSHKERSRGCDCPSFSMVEPNDVYPTSPTFLLSFS